MSFFDLNEAEEQRSGFGIIPPGSIVPLELKIVPPEPEHQSGQHLLLSEKEGVTTMAVDFVVTAGKYAGKVLKKWFVIDGPTEGHKKARQISNSIFRAIAEVNKKISPSDHSAQATAARHVNIEDLDRMLFFAKMKVEFFQNQRGEMVPKNEISRVITIDDDVYSELITGTGEIITDNPVPEPSNKTPQRNHSQSQPAQSPTPQWAQAPGRTVDATQAGTQPQNNGQQSFGGGFPGR